MYFDAVLTIPDQCAKDDKLCEVIKKYIAPKTELFLRGEFTTSGFKIEAGWKGEIDFTEGKKSLVLKQVKLVLKFDLTSPFSISLVGTLTVDGKMLDGQQFDVECKFLVWFNYLVCLHCLKQQQVKMFCLFSILNIKLHLFLRICITHISYRGCNFRGLNTLK